MSEQRERGQKPRLTEEELRQAEEREALRPLVVHETIRREGAEEVRRPVQALAWSGLAAGLSMGFSLIAEGLLRTYLPDARWNPVISKLGYSVGFLIVILGRQQLFTENTLTVILPLLHDWSGRMLVLVARLWLVVLVTNLLGALAFAAVVGNLDLLPPEVHHTLLTLGRHDVAGGFWHIFLTAIFAGWLIALIIWLLPESEGLGPLVIILLAYLIGLGGFAHVIAGSVYALFLVTTAHFPVVIYLWRYLLPALLGNIVGGVALVAILNHAQVVAGEETSGQESA